MKGWGRSLANDLEKSVRDRLTEYASAGVSALPLVGGVLGQALNDVIPNQRIERIVKYIRLLESRLEAIEEKRVRTLLNDPVKQDLVVAGGSQAARALSDKRLKYIARIVANGIDNEEVENIRKSRLLRLLSELDDDEVAILNAYGSTYAKGGTGSWDKVRRPDPPTMGGPSKAVDDTKLYEAGTEQLFRLGLIEQKFSFVKKGELPEFDTRAGRFKGRFEISYLGRMLLREIGLPTEFDKGRRDET
jgi:hypothetical protein